MKIQQILSIFIFSLSFVQLQAQEDIPKGFKKGSITLFDKTVLTGYVKENIRSNASIVFLNEDTKKKKNYDGDGLVSITIDSNHYICIKGDFFKVLCTGSLSLLQKSSDASNKPSYNGSEAIFSSGTIGKPGDYLIFDNTSSQLRLIPKNNLDREVAQNFSSCPDAIDKTKTAKKVFIPVKDVMVAQN